MKNKLMITVIMVFAACGCSLAEESAALSPSLKIQDSRFYGNFSKDMSLEDIKEHMFSVPSMQNGRTVEEVYRINQEEAFFSAQTLSIIERAGSSYDCAVLDIGAGKGTFLKGMVKSARRLNGWIQTIRPAGVIFDFHGFEINENKKNIEALQDEAMDNNDQDFMDLEWTFGETAENLPQDWKNKFTFIFATRSLEYCRDSLKAIEEAYRVLKPGGRAVISMSLINRKEYESMRGQLNSPEESQRLQTIGHIFFEGINLAEEIERLKKDHDVELFAASEKRYERVKVDKLLMRKFMQGQEFPFSHFVIVLNKNSEEEYLQFDYVLECAADAMHRKYISKEKLFFKDTKKAILLRDGLTEQAI